MTDEELGREAWKGVTLGPDTTQQLGANIRRMMAQNRTPARPEVTREAVEDWAVTTWAEIEDHGWQGFVDGVLAAIFHFAPPASTAPILRMSQSQIEAEMYIRMEEKRKNMEGVIYVQECARVAHRLAQPAPVVDPDAEAKRLAWEFYKVMVPDKYKTMEEMWGDLGATLHNGWRAVAAAQKERRE